MKIILPSLGFFGCKSVDMRPPTISDLRAVHSLNREPDLLRIQFVQQLIPSIDLSKITYYDVVYLFEVAAFSACFNKVKYTVTCPECGTVHNFDYVYGNSVVQTLDKIHYPYVKKVHGVEYKFHVLSAQDYLECIESALAEDNYQDALDDNIASKVLGMPVDNLDLSVYLAAHLFHRCTFHGIKHTDVQQCSKCNHVLTTNISIPTDLVTIDLQTLMDQYSYHSDKISFDSFMSLTLDEYKSFINSIK